MKFRKCVALGGATLIFLGCLIIYRIADHTLYPQDESMHQFQTKHSQLKKGGRLFDIKKELLKVDMVLNLQSGNPDLADQKICKRPTNNVKVDLQMTEVYKEVNFDNVDGGVWKQGWNIETDPNKWNSEKILKVYVVPHSHNDPGWRMTFKDYYLSDTRDILNNMLQKMSEDPRKKFIWAEVCYFALWWDEITVEDQEKVRRLINNGQLELVTGGWVMNDEANTHYYSIITQLTEGHQWIKENIGVKPRNVWTIDPFGLSPVMPYFFKQMGLQNLIIHRLHYSLKKHFARTKNLEFRWRQAWDDAGVMDFFTHATPFFSYDVPHSCGPDPKVCCQFDFRRLPGLVMTCPWKEPPRVITKKNVAVRARLLLDQYRKKAELFRTNTILVPLGDDFRFQQSTEWDNQFENYYRLMDYINTTPELHAQVKFGTIDDFFKAIREESPPENFPTLVGDFFTYCDRDDHYWSGFYTSRPFHKRMDRILLNYHRSAEILFALGWGSKGLPQKKVLTPHTQFLMKISDSRRSFSLFQHHDGITGTARDGVMEDYAIKMMDAIADSQRVIQQMTHFLLSPLLQTYELEFDKVYFDFEDQRKHLNELPEKKAIIIGEYETKFLVFFNGLVYNRKELATIYVATPFIEIINAQDNIVPHQICPVFLHDATPDDLKYEISFIAEAAALGLTTYKIRTTAPNQLLPNAPTKVKVFNSLGQAKPSRVFENFETGSGREFSLDNFFMTVNFDANGFLKSVTDKKTSETMPLQLEFVRYLTRKGKERSGAYVFVPEGEAKPVKVESPLIRVYEGLLFSRVEVKLANVKHCLTVYNDPSLVNLGMEIVNVVDITRESNFEFGMRFNTEIKSGNEFYTDLNGFQIIKRIKWTKLPLQANFYPMPTAAFIEDGKTRLTLVTAQPLGVSSLKEGELEVLQDRRLPQDDFRGLGQGVMDNRVTSNSFRIMLERRLENCETPPSLLSTKAYTSSQSLLYPFVKMLWKGQGRNTLQDTYSPVEAELSFDMHLLTIRTLYEDRRLPSAAFVFHRTHLDLCLMDSVHPGSGTVNLDSLLPNHFGDEMTNYSLSFLEKGEKLNRKDSLQLCHMDMLAVSLS